MNKRFNGWLLTFISICFLISQPALGEEKNDGYNGSKKFKKRQAMEKVKQGDQHFLPMPLTIVGAQVNGKPNFQTVSWVSFANWDPALIYVSISKTNYTLMGILKNKTFSVNLPSSDMSAVIDYIGTHSGTEVDKTDIFEVFYGDTKTAPLIKECPINIECKVVKTIDEFPSNYMFIAEIVQVHVGKKYIKKDGMLNTKKLDPMFYAFYDMKYWKLGKSVGTSTKEWKKYKK